ncbi:MAG: peptidoglycan-binding protein [Ruminococcaceae bacterium]|nr:peptidoglycan-binding protein [Oscillospiraceae bacterium]
MTGQNPIYEIQQYLRMLAKDGYQIPLVIPDGIYGEETRTAVQVFQGLLGLPITGRVDYTTWQALRAAYDEVQRNNALSSPIYPFEETLLQGRVTEGDAMPLIYIIQIILRTIGVAYQNLEQQELSGVFDENTIRNVRDFQRVNGIAATGEVDKKTWNRLAEAYNKYLNRA